MNQDELLLLWGKTCRDADDPEAALKYHPLLFHLFDVAHSMLALWDAWVSERWKERVAKAFGCDEPTARALLAVLAGAHDLGKATPPFQYQNTPLDWLRDRLHALGLNSPVRPNNQPHNFVSTKELRHFWREKSWQWTANQKYVASVLSHLTGAHHGTFPNADDYNGWGENEIGDENWRAVRLQLLNALTREFWGDDLEIPPMLDWEDLGAVPFLAGLISVADWIGSSQHFELAGHRDATPTLEQYLPLSRQRAHKALDDFGFASPPDFPLPRPDFARFWGFAPNPLQDAIIAQTRDVGAPFLLICEAPMGSGKTEGALWAADAAFGAGLNRGLYVALPTQATSNAMHERVRKFLKERLPGAFVNLQLVHGNAGLSDNEIAWKPLSTIYAEMEADPAAARVTALSWFTGAKRPLLAPFGVGTIDQSLLAALQTRHYFVRLFGLAGKVVVFDEVHAYDTYMGALIVTTIQWLQELGCSVILLSATLPSGKRRELVEAWGAALPAEEAIYPRLTWCDRSPHAQSIAIEGAELAPKSVKVSHLALESIAQTLREKLRAGGCAAIICNTVAQAQTLFETLRAEFEGWIEPEHLLLFHARMPFGWRKEREDRILQLFGKDKSARPQRTLVISTQVLEQSLDLDFDWMASQMAPTDLLLQRVGRLHRHMAKAGEPPLKRYDLQTPELAILSDAQGDAPPNSGASEWVYEREILLKSWLLWRDKTALELPTEIEPLIEATYAQQAVAPSEAWDKALLDARAEREAAVEKSRQAADVVAVHCKTKRGNPVEPSSFVDAPSRDLRDDDNPKIHAALRAKTREDAQSITVVCLCQIGDNFYLPNRDGTPDLNQPIDFGAEPKHKVAKQLMNFAVPISHKGVCAALANEKVPDNWKKSPFLRHVRRLGFENGEVQVGNQTLRLDGALGIVIEKTGEQAE